MLNLAPLLSLQTSSLSCKISGWLQELDSEHEQKTMATISHEIASQNQLPIGFSRTRVANTIIHANAPLLKVNID